MAATAVQSCPVCLHVSFSSVSDYILAFVGFLQRPPTCPLCGALAPDAQSLGQHLLQHLPSEQQQSNVDPVAASHHQTQYGCKKCEKFFTPDLESMKLHVEAEQPDRKFLCIHCCKLFKGKLLIL